MINIKHTRPKCELNFISITGVIGHNGYNSCARCLTEGEYSYDGGCMIFPQTNAAPRNDRDFRAGVYVDHYKKRTIIENIEGLDMVKDFAIGDVLHLIDLGVMKRFICGWKIGNLNNKNAKWSAAVINDISEFLNQLKLPQEFNRQLRGRDELPYWKGTEYRSFLFYATPVVIKEYFQSEEIYDHFMNFYCAIVICSRHDQPHRNYNIARQMLNDFLKGIKLLYGSTLFTSNVHNLCHLVDDVERFGPLDTFSAYSSESKLFKVKRLVRTGNLPLAQVARRVTEIQQKLPTTISNATNITYRKQIYNFTRVDPTLCNYLKTAPHSFDVYLCVKLKEYSLNAEADADKWVLLKLVPNVFTIFRLQYVLHNSNSEILLYGRVLKELSEQFTKPVQSSALQIFTSNMEEVSSSKIIPVGCIFCKLVKIPRKPKDVTDNSCVFIPLIHTLS